jgi:hypothetical protein
MVQKKITNVCPHIFAQHMPLDALAALNASIRTFMGVSRIGWQRSVQRLNEILPHMADSREPPLFLIFRDENGIGAQIKVDDAKHTREYYTFTPAAMECDPEDFGLFSGARVKPKLGLHVLRQITVDDLKELLPGLMRYRQLLREYDFNTERLDKLFKLLIT